VSVLAAQLVHHTQAQGLGKLARENLSFARRLAEEGIAQTPDEPAFYDVLGILSDIEGDHVGARRNFREFGRKSGHASWRIRTATSYAMECNLTPAVQEVKLGMDVGLGVIGYTYLGKFLDGLGRYDEALDAFKSADAAGVKEPSLLPELQRAYFRVMDVSGVLSAGMRIIAQALRFRPYTWLATICNAITTLGLAVSCRMSKVLWPTTRRVPGLRWVHLRFFPPYEPEMQFGLQLVKNHSFDGALAIFTRALDSCPDNPDVMRNIAATYFNIGHLEKTLSWAEKALDARPDDDELRDILARLKRATQHGA
jgi:tetratricopeptide (TPR) repeat protein